MRKDVMAGFIALGLLAGCMAPTEPVVNYRSENAISYKYKAYAPTPTLTLQVRNLAQTHCATYGKNAEYVGVKIPNMMTTEEVHEFTCSLNKVKVSN